MAAFQYCRALIFSIALAAFLAMPAQVRAQGDTELAPLIQESLKLFYANRSSEAKYPAERALELARQRYGDEHAETAAAELMLGRVLNALTLRSDAEKHLKRAHDIREKKFGGDSVELAEVMYALGVLRRGQRQDDESERLLKRALEIREQKLGSKHELVAETLNSIANIYLNIDGRLSDAERMYKQAFEIVDQLGHSHRLFAGITFNLALANSRANRKTEAEALYRRSLAARQEQHGADSPNLIANINNLASVLRDQQKYDEAEQLFKRSLTIREKEKGAKNAAIVPHLETLAYVQRLMKRYADAEANLKRALAVVEAEKSPDHIDVIARLNSLAQLGEWQGHWAQVELFYARALAIREKQVGVDHPDSYPELRNHGRTLMRLGRHQAAERELRRAVALREKSRGLDHIEVAFALRDLADVFSRQNRFGDAEALLVRAVAIGDKPQNADSRDITWVIYSLADNYERQNRFAEAEPLRRRVIALQEKFNGASAPGNAGYHTDLARVFLALKRTTEADARLKTAVEIGTGDKSSEKSTLRGVLSEVASIYFEQNRFADAEPFLRQQLEIVQAVRGREHIEISRVIDQLVRSLNAQKKYAASVPLLQQALAIREKATGTEQAAISGTYLDLAYAMGMSGQHKEARNHNHEGIKRLEAAPQANERLLKLAYLNEAAISRMLAEGGQRSLLDRTDRKIGSKSFDMEIIAPEQLKNVSRRGALAPTIEQAQFQLVGRLAAPENVSILLVNNLEVPVGTNGEFRATLAPLPGGNQITITAVDEYVNRQTRTIDYQFTGETPNNLPRNYYALVIGIKDYAHIQPLATPLNDARAVADTLKLLYGFRTEMTRRDGPPIPLLLLNANKDQIEEALEALEKHLTEHDALLIYYAGHGEYLKESDDAYWIPRDGRLNSPRSWISAKEIISYLKRMKGRSILLVADSCFSGAMTRDPQDLSTFSVDRRTALLKSGSKASRLLISSGGVAPVLDQGCRETSEHSIFACAFLRGLRENRSEFFASAELHSSFLVPGVLGRAEQDPHRREIANSNHDNGEFVFRRSEYPDL